MNSEIVASLLEKYPSPGINEAIIGAIQNIEAAVEGYKSLPPSLENAKAIASLASNLEAMRTIVIWDKLDD